MQPYGKYDYGDKLEDRLLLDKKQPSNCGVCRHYVFYIFAVAESICKISRWSDS